MIRGIGERQIPFWVQVEFGCILKICRCSALFFLLDKNSNSGIIGVKEQRGTTFNGRLEYE